MPTTLATPATDVTALVEDAVRAFARTRRSSSLERAGWLEALADALDAASGELVAIAVEETHLPELRLSGEVMRTSNQLRLFAAMLREGGYVEAIIDHAHPDATPPTPDLRRMLIPIGPVAVYSASNFPFAFSVLGGDTASALAAGCSVVVKAHSGHPRLSQRTAELAIAALADAGAPDGTLGIVFGRSAGLELIASPGIKAAGFTGSVSGGRALFDTASARPEPIPFYGELGSLNPTFVTRAADAARAGELAAGLAESFQLGMGQFCTKPGIVFIPAGGDLATELKSRVTSPASGRLLTHGIHEAFASGVDELSSHPGVRQIVGASKQSPDESSAVVFVTTLSVLADSPRLSEERFGPTTLLVEYDDLDEAVNVASRSGGSLTATLHAEQFEIDDEIVDRLTQIAGRVLFAGWPTGVAVTWAQHHGGPWPATTSPHTSVGTTAVRRFQRPIAFQSAPEHVLPAELRDENLLSIPRRVDGAPVIE
jgi:NADP-dependent aldehyde dehydrogenase